MRVAGFFVVDGAKPSRFKALTRCGALIPVACRPRTNGFVERMNRTLLDECFRVLGRQT